MSDVNHKNTFIKTQLMPHGVFADHIHAVFNKVDRQAFMPEHDASTLYADTPLSYSRYGAESRHAAPAVLLGMMLYEITLKENSIGKTMLIGAGTGYFAALLSHFATTVIALEQDDSLTTLANTTLEPFENVTVHSGRLQEGWASDAPYDTIVIEGAVDAVPESLFKQLKDDGTLYTVLGQGRSAHLVAMTMTDDTLSTTTLNELALPKLPGFEKAEEFVF